ncbi:MAG: hypothetical protein QM744_09455 [Mesorhizobium sp.]
MTWKLAFALLAVPALTVSEPMRSGHPITPEHQRLRHERALIAELDRAVAARDAEHLSRALLAHRQAFPEDREGLQSGYALIETCLRGGDRGEAEAFYRTRRGSPLRRWIRRVCLER